MEFTESKLVVARGWREEWAMTANEFPFGVMKILCNQIMVTIHNFNYTKQQQQH
jgi:hypothetical protein